MKSGQRPTLDQYHEAAELIMCGETLSDIAKKMDVSRQTISAWVNHSEEFKSVLAQLRHGVVKASQARMSGYADRAITTVIHVMENAEKDSDRLSAAKEVLSRCHIGEDPIVLPDEAEPLSQDAYDQLVAQAVELLKAQSETADGA